VHCTTAQKTGNYNNTQLGLWKIYRFKNNVEKKVTMATSIKINIG